MGGLVVTGSDFALNDGSASLTIENTLSANANIFLHAGTITFGSAGSLQVAGGRIGLQADALNNLGTAGATGGVDAGANGTFELAPGSASGMTLGAASGLSLTDLTGITAGTLRIGAITQPGSASPTIIANAISVAGSFDLGGGTLDLETNGPVSQSAPLTSVGLLTFNGGSIDLTNNGNRIDKLGNGTATSLTLTDSGSLDVAGSVNAPNITLTSDTLGVAGLLDATINGTIALTGTVGGITETGTLIAGALTGSAGSAARTCPAPAPPPTRSAR